MARHAVAERIERSPPSRGLIIRLAVAALAGAIVVAVLIPMLTDRGSSSSVSATATQAPAVASAGQQAVPTGGQAKPGEDDFKRPAGAVRIGDMLFTVVSVKTLDIKPPEKHLKYVAVELTVQNVGQLPASDWSMRLIDSDGVQNIIVLGAEEPAQLGEVGQRFRDFTFNGLKPGAQVQGPLIFKILGDAKPVELRYSSKSGASGVIPLK